MSGRNDVYNLNHESPAMHQVRLGDKLKQLITLGNQLRTAAVSENKVTAGMPGVGYGISAPAKVRMTGPIRYQIGGQSYESADVALGNKVEQLIALANDMRTKILGTYLDGAPALAIGSTPENVANADLDFHLAGTEYHKDAVAAGTALSGDNVPQSKYGGWALDIGIDLTIDITPAADNATGYADAAAAIAGIPAVAGSHIRMGTVTAIKVDVDYLESAPSLQIGTTKPNLAHVEFTHMHSQVQKTEPALPAGIALTGDTIPQNKYGAFRLEIDSGEVLDVVEAADHATGYDTETLALEALPGVSANHVEVGILTVMSVNVGGFIPATTDLDHVDVTENYIGGTLDGFFFPGTTALDDSEVTDVYTDATVGIGVSAAAVDTLTTAPEAVLDGGTHDITATKFGAWRIQISKTGALTTTAADGGVGDMAYESAELALLTLATQAKVANTVIVGYLVIEAAGGGFTIGTDLPKTSDVNVTAATYYNVVGDSGLIAAATGEVSATPEELKIGAATVKVNGIQLAEVAADLTLPFPLADTITAQKWGAWLILSDLAGTAHYVQSVDGDTTASLMAYDSYTLTKVAADALIAAMPNRFVVLGVLYVHNGVKAPWEATTDDITDGSDVTESIFNMRLVNEGLQKIDAAVVDDITGEVGE